MINYFIVERDPSSVDFTKSSSYIIIIIIIIITKLNY